MLNFPKESVYQNKHYRGKKKPTQQTQTKTCVFLLERGFFPPQCLLYNISGLEQVL